MKTILIIIATLLVAILVFVILIFYKPNPKYSVPIDFFNNELPTTSLYFKSQQNTEIKYEHWVDGVKRTEGSIFPSTNGDPSFSTVLLNDNQFKYKNVDENNYQILAWKPNIIKTNLIPYASTIEIKEISPDTPCSDNEANRTVFLYLSESFLNDLIAAGCIAGEIEMCETGNYNNCVAIGYNNDISSSITVTLNHSQDICYANGLTFRCKNGIVIGRITLDDPDDVEIRVVLGGILDNMVDSPQQQTVQD